MRLPNDVWPQLLADYQTERARGEASGPAREKLMAAICEEVTDIINGPSFYTIPELILEQAPSLIYEQWLEKNDGELLPGYRQDGGASVRTWLYRLLGNRVIDILRVEKSHPQALMISEDDDADPVVNIQSDKKGQSSLLRVQRLSEKFNTLLATLPGQMVRKADGKGWITMREDHRRILAFLLDNSIMGKEDGTDEKRMEGHYRGLRKSETFHLDTETKPINEDGDALEQNQASEKSGIISANKKKTKTRSEKIEPFFKVRLPSDTELVLALGIPESTVGRLRREVIHFINNSAPAIELKELMSPMKQHESIHQKSSQGLGWWNKNAAVASPVTIYKPE